MRSRGEWNKTVHLHVRYPKTTISFSLYGGMEVFGVVFLIRKMPFLSPVFPVFTPFFLSKTLANRLFSHENRVWIWEKVLWIPALPLDDADQSSLRMIGQLPFTPLHKQLITIPINWLLLWRIWSIHHARRVAILLPYIKAFHQFFAL